MWSQTRIFRTEPPPSWSVAKDRLTILSSLKEYPTAEKNRTKRSSEKLKIMYMISGS